MNWVTIYDVRNGWGILVASLGLVLSVGFGLSMLIGFVRLFHTQPALWRAPKMLVGAIITEFLFFLLATALAWFVGADLVLRSNLNSGRFSQVEGFIEGAHIESSGWSNPMFFRIGQDWFELPFHYSPACFPHNGDQVRLAFEPIPTIQRKGYSAHTVLKMELTHHCELPMWG